ncbi:MAG TPA: hypothetical protein VFE51_22320 [Verrucomicrobiae bacterium]|nr:hypothetical protein [Verrucomicrobiae bacterium]
MEPINSEIFRKRFDRDRLPEVADIERISRSIADEKGNSDYYISPATWSEIERGATPSIYKLFSLAVCLRMPYEQVMQAFGVDPQHARPGAGLDPVRTELVRINVKELGFSFQLDLDAHLDLRQTNLLQPDSAAWHLLPAPLQERLNPSRYHYAVIGLDDDSMADLVPPGSLVEIDRRQTTIETFAWRGLRERPIYVVRYAQSYHCGWCQQDGETVSLLPHPLSRMPVRRLVPGRNAEIIGRIVSLWFFEPHAAI